MEDAAGSTSATMLPLIDAITPRPYLVTAGRALVEFGLSDQHFFRIVVITSHRLRNWGWQGERVSYAAVAPERIWGLYTPNGPSIALPERAILDSAANSGWGVSVPQIAQALDRGLPGRHVDTPRVDAHNLARMAERYDNAAAARRLGFLVELVRGSDAAEPFRAFVGRNNGSALLNPSGPADAPLDSHWGLRINVDAEALTAHRVIG